jgi:ribosomal RNA-processing protein 36
LEKANKNYSFLSSYQASEILDLKAQIKKSKDPDVIATLKRQVMSLDSKMRAAEAQQRERDIVKRHKQKEKEAIKSGQKSKPYFLKRSDIKREALAEKFDSMGKKARDKAMERKRKRVKGKESKGMPRVRRVHPPGES